VVWAVQVVKGVVTIVDAPLQSVLVYAHVVYDVASHVTYMVDPLRSAATTHAAGL